MSRLLATIAVLLTVLGGSTIGFLAGAQSNPYERDSRARMDLLESARSFYMALNALEPDVGADDLAELLSPDFVEKRIELQQTLDRSAFLRAIELERRFSPRLRFVPVKLGSDGDWVMADVWARSEEPGELAGIAFSLPTRLRREMLHFQGDQIVEHIVLDGNDAIFWPIPAAELPLHGVGPQIIDILQRTYEPHAQEHFELAAPAQLIVQTGRIAIAVGRGPGVVVEPNTSLAIADPGKITISNQSRTRAIVVMVTVASAETPQANPTGMGEVDTAPGVTMQRIAQSGPFFRTASCAAIDAGFASLTSGAHLPRHETRGYELVIPTRASIDAFDEQGAFFRADTRSSWQDRTAFATLDPGVSVVAPPGSLTRYVVSGDEPATLLIVSVRMDDRCREGRKHTGQPESFISPQRPVSA